MMPSHVLGVVLALISAAVWGGGDFSGGVATRRNHAFQVLALVSGIGVGVLVVCAMAWQEPLPSGASCFYAAGAGVAVPVLVTFILGGLPSAHRLVGLLVAIGGIWLVSGASSVRDLRSAELKPAVWAGLGFGGFFLLISEVEAGKVFIPLVVAKGAAFAAAAGLLFMHRLPLPGLKANPVILLAGLLDAGGNVFYVLAKQFTRVDVAVVLASMYPAATVFLARLIFEEGISSTQWVGILLCLTAVGLIVA